MVQAVILVIVSLSWPALRSPLGRSTLLNAARQVRTDLAKTRLRSIQTGVVEELRFQPGTGHFEITSRSALDDLNDSASKAPSRRMIGDGQADTSRVSGDGKIHVRRGTLPEDVCFCGPAEMAGMSETVEPDEPVDSGGAEWSAPVVFYPNGRTSNTRIWLRGPRGDFIDVALRGLTGTATIGEPRRNVESL